MSDFQRMTYDSTWHALQRETLRLEDYLEQRWNTLSSSQRLRLARRLAFCNRQLDLLMTIARNAGLVA